MLGHPLVLRAVPLQARPTTVLRSQRRHIAGIRCEVRSAKGKKLDSDSISVKSSIGEGSFGQVFQGTLETNSGEDRRVILKRVKDRVQGAQEMAEMEHLLNVYASSACKRSVAPFLGYLEVPEPRGRLTKGLWLVWDYEGDKTLAYYLRRRDCISALADDLNVEEEAVIPTIMSQLFECLLDVHAAGLVHRDIKPANIVFCEAERRFKLIDLGATADLRTGTNYRPDQTILDPMYCPPEEYILPTDAPHLSKKAAPIALAMSPLLWQQHRPDCFDSWSAGVVLLQLGLPFLRSPTSLKNWKTTFARCGYDLEEWKMKSGLGAKQTALLDADDGLGWDLAAGLLRPREVESAGRGGVRFVNTGSAPRFTPAQAMKHPFLKKAAGKSGGVSLSLSGIGSLFSGSEDGDEVEEVEDVVGSGRRGSKQVTSGSGSGSGSRGSSKRSGRGAAILDTENAKSASASTSGRVSSSWNWLKSKLFDLEARIAQEASDTQTQTTIVQNLRREVEAGKASKEELEREESRLESMRSSLQASAQEFNSLYSNAKNFLSAVVKPGGSGSKSKKDAAVDKAAEIAASSSSSSSSTADSGTGVTKAVTEVATNAIYSGLKFTGMALNAVSDLAAAAERGVSKAQEEAAARRAASAAFIDALQTLIPAVTASSTWADVSSSIPELDSYAMLTAVQRKQAFEAYLEALKRAQRNAALKAAEAFAGLLEERNPPSNATYEEFSAENGTDARFLGVSGDADRRAAFEAFVAKRRAEEQRAIALAAAESERAAARAEAERQAAIAAAEAAAAAAAAAAQEPVIASSSSPSSSSSSSSSSSPPDLAQIEFLKAEQARLKEEYARMEEKLAQMEKALSVQNLVGSLLEEGSVVESDDKGNVIFKFSDNNVPQTEDEAAASAVRTSRE